MLAAKRLKHACPQCRAQLLDLLQNQFAFPISARAQLQSASSRSRERILGTFTQLRQFATTRRRFQDSHVQESLPQRDDIETIVRQAKKTFGDTLPPKYLTDEEYKLYERLYGPPLRATKPEDVGLPLQASELDAETEQPGQDPLLWETKEGLLMTVPYSVEPPTSATGKVPEEGADEPTVDEVTTARPPVDASMDYIHAVANNDREFDALMKLKQDFETAAALALEKDVEEEIEEEEEDDHAVDREPEYEAQVKLSEPRNVRFHALSQEGRFRTYPSAIQLPVNLVSTIKRQLQRANTGHLREAAETAFGGEGLPYSPATPPSRRNAPMKPLPIHAGHHQMSKIEADVFTATVVPGAFASVRSVLIEVRKRLGPEWIQDMISRTKGDTPGGGPRVLDIGAGGAGLAAWDGVFRADQETGNKYGSTLTQNLEPGAHTVIVGSEHLRSRILHFPPDDSKVRYLPRLPDYLHSAETVQRHIDAPEVPLRRNTQDVIIATYAFTDLDKQYQRKDLVDNLWAHLNPDGGVLIIIEKGHPLGFEAVAAARQQLLDKFILPPGASPPNELTDREPGMIIAPCTNHARCPMYLSGAPSPGRKDFCHFNQRFTRPSFLQTLVGKANMGRDHEDIQFSYLAVRRGPPPPQWGARSPRQGAEAADAAFRGFAHAADPPHMLELPRNLRPPLKNKGHVSMDVCTPAGRLERWTVPKSFGAQAYHDARKALWGDLWALGAKSRVDREPRLGRAEMRARAERKEREEGGEEEEAEGVEGVEGRLKQERAGKQGREERREMRERRERRGERERAEGKGDKPRRRAKGNERARVMELLEGLEEEGNFKVNEDGEIEVRKR